MCNTPIFIGLMHFNGDYIGMSFSISFWWSHPIALFSKSWSKCWAIISYVWLLLLSVLFSFSKRFVKNWIRYDHNSIRFTKVISTPNVKAFFQYLPTKIPLFIIHQICILLVISFKLIYCVFTILDLKDLKD